MTVYIALLRGINVSGQKKVPMAALRAILSNAGLQEIQTYIQSGNVVFRASNGTAATLEKTIQEAIKQHFGFEVPVLVKTASQIEQILNDCPFPQAQKEQSYFTLLQEAPAQELVSSTANETYDGETFQITEACVYFYSETGYGKAKCNNNFFERKLKVAATTRNYKTMRKLLSLCSDIQ